MALNLRAVLDLGNLTYFTFRGRAYGVPPLPFPAAEKILATYQAIKARGEITPENREAYFRDFRRLARLLWRRCSPAGKNPFRWLAYWLHLRPNRFRRLATEGDLVDLALFTLGRRMRRNVRWPEMQTQPSPGT